MAVLRATMAARLAEEEKLTVARLAKRLGVSKTRAQQLADIGRRLSPEGRPPRPRDEHRADEGAPPAES